MSTDFENATEAIHVLRARDRGFVPRELHCCRKCYRWYQLGEGTQLIRPHLEAQLAEAFICPGSSLHALETAFVTHRQVPGQEGAFLACCGQHLASVPVSDRFSTDPSQVTCPGHKAPA
jgi:hypothetical protein